MNISYASTFTHHLDSLPSNSIKLVFLWSKISSMTTIETLCNMIVLAVRLKGHFLAAKSYFQCTKKWTRRTRRGKISAQPHTTLSIQFLNRANNDKYNTLPLGKQICLTIVWGYAEILSSLISQANILIFS